MSQGKRKCIMCGAVGRSALMAGRTRSSMYDFLGMSLAHRFSPNRKMSRTAQYLSGFFCLCKKKMGFFIVWRYNRQPQFSQSAGCAYRI
jgi:hypothetical protein